jgi:hypothetical protein
MRPCLAQIGPDLLNDRLQCAWWNCGHRGNEDSRIVDHSVCQLIEEAAVGKFRGHVLPVGMLGRGLAGEWLR